MNAQKGISKNIRQFFNILLKIWVCFNFYLLLFGQKFLSIPKVYVFCPVITSYIFTPEETAYFPLVLEIFVIRP